MMVHVDSERYSSDYKILINYTILYSIPNCTINHIFIAAEDHSNSGVSYILLLATTMYVCRQEAIMW